MGWVGFVCLLKIMYTYIHTYIPWTEVQRELWPVGGLYSQNMTCERSYSLSSSWLQASGVAYIYSKWTFYIDFPSWLMLILCIWKSNYWVSPMLKQENVGSVCKVLNQKIIFEELFKVIDKVHKFLLMFVFQTF